MAKVTVIPRKDLVTTQEWTRFVSSEKKLREYRKLYRMALRYHMRQQQSILKRLMAGAEIENHGRVDLRRFDPVKLEG